MVNSNKKEVLKLGGKDRASKLTKVLFGSSTGFARWRKVVLVIVGVIFAAAIIVVFGSIARKPR